MKTSLLSGGYQFDWATAGDQLHLPSPKNDEDPRCSCGPKAVEETTNLREIAQAVEG